MEFEEIDYVLGKTEHLRAVNYHFYELQRIYYNMAVAKDLIKYLVRDGISKKDFLIFQGIFLMT